MTQTIEQLTARVRELEEELDAAYKAVDDNWVSHQQLVASQAYAEQLREALNAWIGIASNCSIESGVCCCGEAMKNHSSPMACGHSPVDMADSVVHSAIQKTDKALGLPRDTSALDAYVAEKVKEESDELTALNDKLATLLAETAVALKGEEAALTRHTWHDLPVIALAKIVEIATLTRQRDLAVEALEHIARSLPQIGVERVWMMDHANKVLSTIKESEAK